MTQECQTPEAMFHITVTPEKIGVMVDLPSDQHNWGLSEQQAKKLEDELHDALEQILAKRWQRT